MTDFATKKYNLHYSTFFKQMVYKMGVLFSGINFFNFIFKLLTITYVSFFQLKKL